MKNRAIIFLVIAVCLQLALVGSSFAQPKSLPDSILRYIETAPRDSVFVDKLSRYIDVDQMNGYGNALHWAYLSLSISDSINYERGRGVSLMHLAIIYDMQGQYQRAMEYYIDASRVLKKVNDEDHLSVLYQNMGFFYSAQGNYRQAIDITHLAADISYKLYGELGPSYNWGNLGYYYAEMGEYDSALYYTLKAYEILKVEKDSAGLGEVFFNLGYIAIKADSNVNKALNYALQAEEYYMVPPIELETLVECRLFLGTMYRLSGQYLDSERYLNLALKDAEANSYRAIIKNIHKQLAYLRASQGDWRSAYKFYDKFFQLHDSIYNQKSSSRVDQLKADYEVETREARIELLKKDQIIQRDELDRQMLLRNSFIGLFGLFATVAFVLYRSNESKNKTNKLLVDQKRQIEVQHEAILRQNELLEDQKLAMLDQADYLEDANTQIIHQKETIEQKNRDITDSLNYARRMQHAMLPDPLDLNNHLPESFIWLQPRDIVSGDFYWFAKANNRLYLAAIDCTGHGVPGAFMSLIGDVYLNQIVYQEGETSSCKILERLHNHVRKALNQETTFNQDGMEVALCVIDLPNNKVEYAGARNSLYYIQHNEVVKVSGDRVYVGGYLPTGFTGFTCKEISFDQATSFYMCTDGVKDQFGGIDDKKFGENRFKQLLLSIQKLPFEEQNRHAQHQIQEWMKGYDQVDDMLLMGWRV